MDGVGFLPGRRHARFRRRHLPPGGRRRVGIPHQLAGNVRQDKESGGGGQGGKDGGTREKNVHTCERVIQSSSMLFDAAAHHARPWGVGPLLRNEFAVR